MPLKLLKLTTYDDLSLAFFFAGATVPEARGRGFYSAVVAARVEFARQRGLGFVGLYARKGTSSPITQRQGFEVVGEMSYWTRAADVS